MSKPRCQSLTQAGRQCRLPASEDSKYCKRHKGVLVPEVPEIKIDSKTLLCPKLSPDTELLMFGYLPLEDILTLFKNNSVARDKILKIYFPELPSIEQAIESKALETLKYLIEHKQQELNSTNVRMVIYFGDLKMYKYLVSLGTVVTFPTQSNLDMAIHSEKVEIVRFILDLGIKGLKPSKGTLDWVSNRDNLELVKILVEQGHKITKYILCNACRSSNPEILKYLLTHGGEADHNTLEYASRRGTQDAVKYLIATNVKITPKVLIQSAGRGFLEILRLAVQQGIMPPNKVLDSATEGYQIQVIEYLLSIGVRPTIKTRDIAKYKGYSDLVELYKI